MGNIFKSDVFQMHVACQHQKQCRKYMSLNYPKCNKMLSAYNNIFKGSKQVFYNIRT